MTDDQLNALWTEITRTAAPGARVIFRTAAEPSLLPGRVSPTLLDQWHYEDEASRDSFGARPLGDLWRLPPLREERLMSTTRCRPPCRTDGRRLSLPAPHLRPDPQILSARPRPADRRARGAGGRHACWNSAAAPGATSALAARRLSRGPLLRPRHLGRDARDGAASRSAARACPAASRWHAATPPISIAERCSASSGFDRIFISYSLSMIPRLAKRTIVAALDALAPGGSLHIVDFGQQEGLPGWFRAAAARLAGQVPCHAA